MAGLKSKMLSRGRKKNQTKASSSSSASTTSSSDAAKAAAVAKLTAIRQEAANASSDVDVDLNGPSNRTTATSASATPSPNAALDRSAGEGVEIAEADADLDLTGTLEEVNQILGIVPATTNTAAAEAEAVADDTAAATAADAASSSLRGPREEARDGRSMLDESEEVPPSPLMDYSKSCPSGDDDDDDEVGIEVQLQLEPSFDDQAIGLDGGVGVVIQEPTVAGQKKILVATEEVSSEAMEEAIDLSAIAPTALFPEPEPVEEAVVVEEKSLQADTAEVEGTTAPAAPVVTPEAGASDAAAAAGAAVAAGAATAASVAAFAAASDSRAPNEADADTVPPAKKGPGLGVSKFPDKAEPALDDCVSFITAFKASFTEAVQPGLDSVRKTLNFGATPPPSKVEEGGSNNAAAVAAAAVVSADKGANSSQTTSNDTKPVVTPTETMADSPIAGPSDTSFSSKANGVAKTLLTAFDCASNDTTKPVKVGKQVDASPTSNSLFESPSTLTSATKAEEDAANARFLKEITEEGIVLLVHQAPNSTGGNPTSDWTQKIVRVYIKPGSGGAGQPKLMWARNKSLPMTRKTGVPEDRAGEKKIRWTSLDLLDIHSILGATDGDKLPTSNEEQMEKKGDESEGGGIAGQSCFFTITSGKGAVFVFEAMTPEERNRVSKGLQAVITGLARALITGDIDKYVALVKDARDEGAEEEGELPSLRTPAQAMNEIAHALLD